MAKSVLPSRILLPYEFPLRVMKRLVVHREVADEVSCAKRGSDSPPKNDGTRDEVDAADARS